MALVVSLVVITIIPHGATQAPSYTSDSCDTYSMMQSRVHASLSPVFITKSVDASSREKLASFIREIKRDTANLKMGDPLPDIVNTSLRTIEEAIGEMLSSVEQNVGSQRQSLTRLATAFQNCVTISTQTWPNIAEGSNPLQNESDHVSTLKNLHSECRSKEVGPEMQEAIGQGGTCDGFLQEIENLQSIKPENLTQAGLASFFEAFDVTAFSQKASSCDSAVKSYALTVENCKANQTAYERAVCHWHTSTRHVENACESISSCRDSDGTLLEEECTMAKDRAKAWKAEGSAIKHIKCLLEKLFSGKYDQIKICNSSIAEGEENYEITCPDVTTSSEEEAKCSNLATPADIAVVPGSDTWITTYSSEAWYNKSTNSAGGDAKITAQVQCELPGISCPNGKVPNSANNGCEVAPTTTTTTTPTIATGSYEIKDYDPNFEKPIAPANFLKLSDYNAIFDVSKKYYTATFFGDDEYGFVGGYSHPFQGMVIARFDLATMNHVDTLDLEPIKKFQYGFGMKATVDGDWAYVTSSHYSPSVIRFHTKNFTADTAEAIDWSARFPSAIVRDAHFAHGGYVYMSGFTCGHPFAHDDPRANDLPVWKEGGGWAVCPAPYRQSGKYAYTVRVPTSNFHADAVEVLDLTFLDKCDEGICGMITSGFTDGSHGYYIPSYGAYDNKRIRHVLRFRLDTFSEPEFINFNDILPYHTTFGYGGGFALGQNTYFIVSDGKHLVSMNEAGEKTLHDLSGTTGDNAFIRGAVLGSSMYLLGNSIGNNKGISLLTSDLPSFNGPRLLSWKEPATLPTDVALSGYGIFVRGEAVFASAGPGGHVFKFEGEPAAKA